MAGDEWITIDAEEEIQPAHTHIFTKTLTERIEDLEENVRNLESIIKSRRERR